MKNIFLRFTNKKKGITLVEVMMAVGIMILLNGILSVFIIRAFDVNRYSIEQGLNTAIVQNSLHSLSRYLREARQSDSGGYLIELANQNELTFFANVDDDDTVERIHLYLDNGQLLMGLSEASGFPLDYPENDQETKIMASNIVNDSLQPLFTFYNKDYPEDTENNPLTTPAQPGEISLIRINVYANIDPNRVPNKTQIETFIRPRNIDYY